MSEFIFEPADFLAFRDMGVCKKVVKIKKDVLCRNPEDAHLDFKVRISNRNLIKIQ